MTTTTKFSGDINALKAIIAATGVTGHWSGRNPYKFTADNGAIIRWWSATKTLVFQGREAARDALEDAYSAVLAGKVQPPDSGDTDGESRGGVR